MDIFGKVIKVFSGKLSILSGIDLSKLDFGDISELFKLIAALDSYVENWLQAVKAAINDEKFSGGIPDSATHSVGSDVRPAPKPKK